MYLILLLFLAVQQGKQPFKPDLAIVADEIDQFDGTVIRQVYAFHNLSVMDEKTGKTDFKLHLVGVIASTPDNIKIKEGNLIKMRDMEIRPKKLLMYKGAPDPIHEYVNQFDVTEEMWFGFNPKTEWCCP